MTVLTLKNEANYAARVVRIQGLVPLAGLDRLVGVSVDGFMALVSKDTTVGSLVVAFVAESQLSDAFLSAHDLYRHSEKNLHPEQAGYIEDNRRVRAVKFRGHMSSALLLDAALLGVTDDQEGALFDTIDGVEISRKYYVKRSSQINAQARQIAKAFAQVQMPLHIETENYWRNSHLIPQDAFVTVTQKVHGTSVRYGHLPVTRNLHWWERLLKWSGVPINETEYAFIVGSRKVIKSVVRD